MSEQDVVAEPEPDPSTILDRPSSSRLSIPSHPWRAHWLTVAEFSRVMGRCPTAVYNWIDNGTLAEFGIPMCHFRTGRRHSGRVFILNIY